MSVQIDLHPISGCGASMGISGAGAASKSRPRAEVFESGWSPGLACHAELAPPINTPLLSGLAHPSALPLKTGNPDLDSQDSVALQRTEVLLDQEEGGGLMRLVRAAVIWWSFGRGDASEKTTGIPRVHGAEIETTLQDKARPGDILLCGVGGKLTHAALYTGEGKILHSMATEKTQRGFFERVVDLFSWPVVQILEWVGWRTDLDGTIEEPAAQFFDRFYRDSYAILRAPELTPEQRATGLAEVRENFLGKSYDWDLVPANEELYCSEVVGEFMRRALGDRAPRVGAKTVSMGGPLMQRRGVVEPEHFLQSPDLTVVAANSSATATYPQRLSSSP